MGLGARGPHDRAVAAGYGGGAAVYVSENVATGVDLSPSTTVYQMWQDAVHLETMISSSYRHIGAGVAEADGWVYYTIDVGYVAGESRTIRATTHQVPTLPGGTPAPTAIALIPIALATPGQMVQLFMLFSTGNFWKTLPRHTIVTLQNC